MKRNYRMLFLSVLLLAGCKRGNQTSSKEQPSILTQDATDFVLYYKTLLPEEDTTFGFYKEADTDVEYVRISDEKGKSILKRIHDKFNPLVSQMEMPGKDEQFGGGKKDLGCIVLTYHASDIDNYFIPSTQEASYYAYYQTNIPDSTNRIFSGNLYDEECKEIYNIFESTFKEEENHQHKTAGKDHLFQPK